MRTIRKWLTFTVLLLCVSLALGACAQKTAPPAEQALLDTGEKLKSLRTDYVKTNAKYVAQCPPSSFILDAATCDAWTRYTQEFVREYEEADAAWRRGAQATSDAKADALKAKLAPYTAKTK